jgi:predicted PhzF superfamily epimerase YddE/YHI9
MRAPICVIDAFTAEPFRGNPAAVCFPAGPVGADWMQRVAAEMNLSETAFVVARGDEWELRWFTPAAEVALCGHATLAAAHALWESGRLRSDQSARFQTLHSGLLTCERAGPAIAMDFPSRPATAVEPPDELIAGLGERPLWTGKSTDDFLCELPDEAAVRRLKPDLVRLSLLPVRGVIVTARAGGADYDIVSRFFAPAVGVPEDPVTGSAHCTLAPYWSARLGKRLLRGWQASARGGEVVMRLSASGDRVQLLGDAVTVWKGELV